MSIFFSDTGKLREIKKIIRRTRRKESQIRAGAVSRSTGTRNVYKESHGALAEIEACVFQEISTYINTGPVDKDQAVALLTDIGERRMELKRLEDELREDTKEALRFSHSFVSRAEASRLTRLNRSTIYELYLVNDGAHR